MKRSWVAIAVAALALSAGLGVLTAHMEHSDASRTPGGPEFDKLLEAIPAYPGSSFFPLGNELHVEGEAREMGYAVTDDSPQKVADRYEAIWTSQGLPVGRESFEQEERLLVASPFEPLVRTVIIAADNDHTTIIASVHSRDNQRSLVVPRPPECSVVSSTGAVDGIVRTDLVMLDCSTELSMLLPYYDGILGATKRTVEQEPTIDKKEASIRYDGSDIYVRLDAAQIEMEPPRTMMKIVWQVEQRP